MFKISLKDVGAKRATHDILVDVSFLDDAIEVAVAHCISVLDRKDFRVVKQGDNEYNLEYCYSFLGSFTIVKQ